MILPYNSLKILIPTFTPHLKMDCRVSESCRRLIAGIEDGGSGPSNLDDLRTVRAACADAIDIEAVFEANVISSLFSYCKSIARHSQLSHHVDASFDAGRLSTHITILCQVIANFAANKGKYAEAVWHDARDEGFQDLLVVSKMTGNRSTLAIVIAALHNCTCGESEAALARLETLVRNRALLSQILLSVPELFRAPLGNERLQSLSSADSDPALEWTHLLTCNVLLQGLMSEMFFCVSHREGPSASHTGGEVWAIEPPSPTLEADVVPLIMERGLTHEQV